MQGFLPLVYTRVEYIAFDARLRSIVSAIYFYRHSSNSQPNISREYQKNRKKKNFMTRMTHKEYCVKVHAAYDTHLATLANYAISFLDEMFFNRLETLASRCNDADVTIPFTQVAAYLKKNEAQEKLTVKWSEEDLVRQVMLFIAAELTGVPYLYSNDLPQKASVVVRNPLFNEDHQDDGCYKITIKNDQNGKDLPVITVHMKVALPNSLYDPLRPNKRMQEELPASNL